MTTSPFFNWLPWVILGHPANSQLQGPPVLAASADGRLELFAVGVDGSLYHAWQVAVGGGWSNWASHGHPATSLLHRPPALAPGADGRLELFAVGDDGLLYHIWQVAVNAQWSDWFSHGRPTEFPLKGTPALASQQDGRLHIFVVDSNGSLFSGQQTTPNGTWSFWFAHPAPNEG